jgi:hypothetical protein
MLNILADSASVVLFHCVPASVISYMNNDWPTSCLGGQSFRLLAMRSRVRFPVLRWEIFLGGEDPHSDHGLGSLYNLGLRFLLVLHAHTHHHSHHRGNVTEPYGRPNLRSRLHFGHNQEGDHDVYMDMWWHWKKKGVTTMREMRFIRTMTLRVCAWFQASAAM